MLVKSAAVVPQDPEAEKVEPATPRREDLEGAPVRLTELEKNIPKYE